MSTITHDWEYAPGPAPIGFAFLLEPPYLGRKVVHLLIESPDRKQYVKLTMPTCVAAQLGEAIVGLSYDDPEEDDTPTPCGYAECTDCPTDCDDEEAS